jgi:hypothetical protein
MAISHMTQQKEERQARRAARRLENLPPGARMDLEKTVAWLLEQPPSAQAKRVAIRELKKRFRIKYETNPHDVTLILRSVTAISWPESQTTFDFAGDTSKELTSSEADSQATSGTNLTKPSAMTLPVEPPRSAEFLLFVFLDPSDRDAVIGDLTEEYESELVPRFGLARARAWYWVQVFRSLMPLARTRLKRFCKLAVVAELVHRAWSRLS